MLEGVLFSALPAILGIIVGLISKFTQYKLNSKKQNNSIQSKELNDYMSEESQNKHVLVKSASECQKCSNYRSCDEDNRYTPHNLVSMPTHPSMVKSRHHEKGRGHYENKKCEAGMGRGNRNRRRATL